MADIFKKIRVTATKENLETVTAFLDEILDEKDCPLKVRLQIDLALEEMYINIANYAYTPKIGEMELRVAFDEAGRELTMVLIDSGIPYDPLAKKDPDVTLSAEKRKIGGLGIYLVKKTMDSMTYERREKKNAGIPYLLHPMEAAVIVGTMTNDQEILAAALLHDVVEDTNTTIEEVRERFGDRVARLVASETENKREELPPGETWRIRKEESLEELRNSSKDVKMLWLGDKLSNMRSFYRSWDLEGANLWQAFNMKDSSLQYWYYSTIAELLRPELSDYPAWKEYYELVKRVFKITELEGKTEEIKMAKVSGRTAEGKLFISLEGRVDSTNAAETEEALNALRAEAPGTPVVLDCRELQYISSAGLRMILRLRKADPEASIVNVIPEVYEIFDMTGFTDMMPVSKI